jgi:hypothetical protein
MFKRFKHPLDKPSSDEPIIDSHCSDEMIHTAFRDLELTEWSDLSDASADPDFYNAFRDQNHYLIVKEFIHQIGALLGVTTKEYVKSCQEWRSLVETTVEHFQDELGAEFLRGVKKIKYDVYDWDQWREERGYFIDNVIIPRVVNDAKLFIDHKTEIISVLDTTDIGDLINYSSESSETMGEAVRALPPSCAKKIVDEIKTNFREGGIFEKIFGAIYIAGITEVSYQVIYEKIDSQLIDKVKNGTGTSTPIGELSPHDYEKACAQILDGAGWRTQLTKVSGDQGADIIAEKSDKKLVVQCKLYNSTVGTKAVQEVISGQKFYTADYAAVVSSAGYTSGARDLAKMARVLLLSKDDLQHIDSLLRTL